MSDPSKLQISFDASAKVGKLELDEKAFRDLMKQAAAHLQNVAKGIKSDFKFDVFGEMQKSLNTALNQKGLNEFFQSASHEAKTLQSQLVAVQKVLDKMTALGGTIGLQAPPKLTSAQSNALNFFNEKGFLPPKIQEKTKAALKEYSDYQISVNKAIADIAKVAAKSGPGSLSFLVQEGGLGDASKLATDIVAAQQAQAKASLEIKKLTEKKKQTAKDIEKLNIAQQKLNEATTRLEQLQKQSNRDVTGAAYQQTIKGQSAPILPPSSVRDIEAETKRLEALQKVLGLNADEHSRLSETLQRRKAVLAREHFADKAVRELHKKFGTGAGADITGLVAQMAANRDMVTPQHLLAASTVLKREIARATDTNVEAELRAAMTKLAALNRQITSSGRLTKSAADYRAEYGSKKTALQDFRSTYGLDVPGFKDLAKLVEYKKHVDDLASSARLGYRKSFGEKDKDTTLVARQNYDEALKLKAAVDSQVKALKNQQAKNAVTQKEREEIRKAIDLRREIKSLLEKEVRSAEEQKKLQKKLRQLDEERLPSSAAARNLLGTRLRVLGGERQRILDNESAKAALQLSQQKRAFENLGGHYVGTNKGQLLDAQAYLKEITSSHYARSQRDYIAQSDKYKNDKEREAANLKFSEQLGVNKSRLGAVNAALSEHNGFLHQSTLAIRQFLRYAIGYQAGFTALSKVTQTFSESLGFDKTVHGIKAISQATKEEMRVIEASIKGVATSSEFAMKEVGDAAKILAQAGVPVSEIPAILSSVEKLASTAGAGLQETANIITSLRTVYSKTGPVQVAALADELANAVNISKLTIQGLGTITSLVATTAKESNLSTSQLLGAAATLSNRGIKDSTIATGLRQAMLEVFSPDQKTLGFLRSRYAAIGESKTDVQIKAMFQEFKNSTSPLVAAIREMRRIGVAGQGRSEFSRVFDVRAENIWLPLLDSLDVLEENISRVSQTGSTVRGAATNMEAFSNQASAANSAVLSLTSTLMEGFLPAMTRSTKGFKNLVLALEDSIVDSRVAGNSGYLPTFMGVAAGALAAKYTRGGAIAKGTVGALAGTSAIAGGTFLQGGEQESSTAGTIANAAINAALLYSLLRGPVAKGFAAAASGAGKVRAVFASLGSVTAAVVTGFNYVKTALVALTPQGKLAALAIAGVTAGLSFLATRSDPGDRLKAAQSKLAKQQLEKEKTAAEYAQFDIDTPDSLAKRTSDALAELEILKASKYNLNDLVALGSNQALEKGSQANKEAIAKLLGGREGAAEEIAKLTELATKAVNIKALAVAGSSALSSDLKQAMDAVQAGTAEELDAQKVRAIQSLKGFDPRLVTKTSSMEEVAAGLSSQEAFQSLVQQQGKLRLEEQSGGADALIKAIAENTLSQAGTSAGFDVLKSTLIDKAVKARTEGDLADIQRLQEYAASQPDLPRMRKIREMLKEYLQVATKNVENTKNETKLAEESHNAIKAETARRREVTDRFGAELENEAIALKNLNSELEIEREVKSAQIQQLRSENKVKAAADVEASLLEKELVVAKQQQKIAILKFNQQLALDNQPFSVNAGLSGIDTLKQLQEPQFSKLIVNAPSDSPIAVAYNELTDSAKSYARADSGILSARATKELSSRKDSLEANREAADARKQYLESRLADKTLPPAERAKYTEETEKLIFELARLSDSIDKLNTPEKAPVKATPIADTSVEVAKAKLYGEMQKAAVRQGLDFSKLKATVETTSATYNVPESVLLALIKKESGFDKDVLGPSLAHLGGQRAQGFGQFLKGTAARFGLSDRTDPYKSIEAIGKYLDYNRKFIGTDDLELLIASHNTGEGNVKKYGRGVLSDDWNRKNGDAGQTKKYVSKIFEWAGLSKPGASGLTAAQVSGVNAAGLSASAQASVQQELSDLNKKNRDIEVAHLRKLQAGYESQEKELTKVLSKMSSQGVSQSLIAETQAGRAKVLKQIYAIQEQIAGNLEDEEAASQISSVEAQKQADLERTKTERLTNFENLLQTTEAAFKNRLERQSPYSGYFEGFAQGSGQDLSTVQKATKFAYERQATSEFILGQQKIIAEHKGSGDQDLNKKVQDAERNVAELTKRLGELDGQLANMNSSFLDQISTVSSAGVLREYEKLNQGFVGFRQKVESTFAGTLDGVSNILADFITNGLMFAQNLEEISSAVQATAQASQNLSDTTAARINMLQEIQSSSTLLKENPAVLGKIIDQSMAAQADAENAARQQLLIAQAQQAEVERKNSLLGQVTDFVSGQASSLVSEGIKGFIGEGIKGLLGGGESIDSAVMNGRVQVDVKSMPAEFLSGTANPLPAGVSASSSQGSMFGGVSHGLDQLSSWFGGSPSGYDRDGNALAGGSPLSGSAELSSFAGLAGGALSIVGAGATIYGLISRYTEQNKLADAISAYNNRPEPKFTPGDYTGSSAYRDMDYAHLAGYIEMQRKAKEALSTEKLKTATSYLASPAPSLARKPIASGVSGTEGLRGVVAQKSDSSPIYLKVVNVEDAAATREHMTGADGDRVILNSIRRNAAQYKRILS